MLCAPVSQGRGSFLVEDFLVAAVNARERTLVKESDHCSGFHMRKVHDQIATGVR